MTALPGQGAELLAAGALALLLGAGTLVSAWRADGPALPADLPEPARAVQAPRPAPERVDLNRADGAALERLPGIGPALARRILAEREAHGRYRSVDELLRVSGIGRGRLERLRPWAATGEGE